MPRPAAELSSTEIRRELAAILALAVLRLRRLRRRIGEPPRSAVAPPSRLDVSRPTVLSGR